MNTGFSLTEKIENDIMILNIQGELDALVAPQLKEKITKSLEEEVVNFVINFKEVTHINSLAMGILRGQLKTVKASGGDIKLTNINDHIFSIFEMIGLDELFEIYKSEEEALKEYNK